MKGESTMHDVFYFTDIHGQWRLFKAITNYCIAQDPECTIIFGGDACDRGPDGYRIMKSLLNNPQVIYLMGNHEDMFVKACDAIIGYHAKNDDLYNQLHHYTKEQAELILKELSINNMDVCLACGNGGFSTLLDWILDGADEEIVDNIRMLPLTCSYENIDFCHAGSIYKFFEEASKDQYENTHIHFAAEQALLWDRNSIPLGWKTGRICVHGHTPTFNLPARAYGSHDKSLAHAHPAIWGEMMGGKEKRGGKKINMDTGATFSGRAYVLNVLTMKVKGFFDPAVVGLQEDIQELEEYKINLD